METTVIKDLYWESPFGGNLYYLFYEGKVVASVNWNIIEQKWYASQGKKGKPQYVFPGMKWGDSEKVKEKVFNIVKSKLR